MPNRIIKASLLTSTTVAKLTAEEERHMIRMLLLVDDYGCLEVSPDILRAYAYPKILGDVTEADVAKWTSALVDKKLLCVWEENERTWGVFRKFDYHSGRAYTDGGIQTRNRRKTPIPPTDVTTNTCAKLGQTRPDKAPLGPVLVGGGVPVGVGGGVPVNKYSSSFVEDPNKESRQSNPPFPVEVVAKKLKGLPRYRFVGNRRGQCYSNTIPPRPYIDRLTGMWYWRDGTHTNGVGTNHILESQELNPMDWDTNPLPSPLVVMDPFSTVDKTDDKLNGVSGTQNDKITCEKVVTP